MKGSITDKSLLLVILITALAFFALVGIQFYLFGTGEDSTRVIIRGTARTSAVLFAIAFSASSIHYLTQSDFSASLLKYRPHFGLAFTVSHTIHLISLFYLQAEIHPVFTLAKTSSLLAGGTAYIFMYLMAITTFFGPKSRVSQKSWRWLHLIGGYWIWAIFFNSYFKNVMNHDRYHTLLIMMVFVIVLRIAHWMKRRSKREG